MAVEINPTVCPVLVQHPNHYNTLTLLIKLCGPKFEHFCLHVFAHIMFFNYSMCFGGIGKGGIGSMKRRKCCLFKQGHTKAKCQYQYCYIRNTDGLPRCKDLGRQKSAICKREGPGLKDYIGAVVGLLAALFLLPPPSCGQWPCN